MISWLAFLIYVGGVIGVASRLMDEKPFPRGNGIHWAMQILGVITWPVGVGMYITKHFWDIDSIK